MNRSEKYRRLVASLPCIHCGVYGYSHAAHANSNKGMGIKSDDSTCFPLCADRFMVRGCHSRFDQGGLFDKPTRRRLEVEWAEKTRSEIKAMQTTNLLES